MIVTTVLVQVKSEHIDDFIRSTAENHHHSVKEQGNIRFDVTQKDGDPTRFLLYEAYENEAAAAAHKETAHYQKWRQLVAPWMAAPREGIRYNILYPK